MKWKTKQLFLNVSLHHACQKHIQRNQTIRNIKSKWIADKDQSVTVRLSDLKPLWEHRVWWGWTQSVTIAADFVSMTNIHVLYCMSEMCIMFLGCISSHWGEHCIWALCSQKETTLKGSSNHLHLAGKLGCISFPISSSPYFLSLNVRKCP